MKVKPREAMSARLSGEYMPATVLSTNSSISARLPLVDWASLPAVGGGIHPGDKLVNFPVAAIDYHTGSLVITRRIIRKLSAELDRLQPPVNRPMSKPKLFSIGMIAGMVTCMVLFKPQPVHKG